MKKIKKHLKKTDGFSLMEVVLSISLFTFGMAGLYPMMIGTAKIQKYADQTYQARLEGQTLLKNISRQIEKDLGQAHKDSRKLPSSGEKPWLKEEKSQEICLEEFLERDPKDKPLGDFTYEARIWEMGGGAEKKKVISLRSQEILESEPAGKDPWDTIGLDTGDTPLWSDLVRDQDPIEIGQVIYDSLENMIIKPKAGKENEKLEISWSWHEEEAAFLIEDRFSTRAEETGHLVIDLTSFPSAFPLKCIKIENKAGASLVVSVYNEQNPGEIKIEPLGNTLIHYLAKPGPNQNFTIGIMVKDQDKVLSKIVDVFSYDYNKN